MRSVSFTCLFVLATLCLGACVGAEADLQVIDSPVASTSREAVALRAGDTLRINVFGEDKLSGSYQIDPTGNIDFPLVGSLTAAGSTRTDVEQALAAKLAAKYLKSPKVSVRMASNMPFYILGEVEKPGRYDYDGGLNVWRAIAMAGGQTYRASTDKVLIQHAGDPHWQEINLTASVLVDPGDLIRVPDRWF